MARWMDRYMDRLADEMLRLIDGKMGGWMDG